MASISNTPRPGYVYDSATNEWIPIGVGGHSHPDYATTASVTNSIQDLQILTIMQAQ